MSAAEALKAARAAGMSVMIDDDDLILEASTSPPPDVLDALRIHKTDIVALLAPRADDGNASAPIDFLTAVKRSRAELFVVGGRLVLRGEFDPALCDELERHRAVLEAMVGTERLGGITAETAAATAVILSSFRTKARLLNTTREATAAIGQLVEAAGNDGVIGADIETTPLASFAIPRPPLIITPEGAISSKQPSWNNDAGLDPYRAEVRVLSLWNPRGGDALVIDLRHVPISALPKVLWNARLVFYNATFDTKHLLHAGAPLQADKLLCSMLFAGFVARGQPFNNREGDRRPSLAIAAKELLGIDVPKAGQSADWDRPKLDQSLADYAAVDAVMAYQILKAGVGKMGTGEKQASDIACACIHGVARLELTGLPFDTEVHRATALALEGQLRSAQTKAKGLASINNLNSSTQIAAWLTKALPKKVLENWPRTDCGALSTEGKVLRRHAEHHAGLKAIADYSRLRALNASFGLSLLDKINPVTNRLHTSLQIAQAKSGRFSSKNPNLQNMPRDGLFRSAVRAQAGSGLVVADYSQIELRVLAEVACDARLRDAYARGLDLHAITAAAMLDIAPDQFDTANPEHAAARQKAKSVNFGIVFGCGAPGLVEFARDSYSVKMTEREAGSVIATWLRTYSDVASWQKRHAANCKLSGVVKTPAGRIYRFAWEPNGKFNYNLALNLPIQGGAAEVAQVAIAKTDALLTKHLGERARLVGQVHDEFLVMAEEPVAERAKALLIEAMTDAFTELFPDAPVRGLVAAKIVASWSQAKG
jgi:DNA polymerase I